MYSTNYTIINHEKMIQKAKRELKKKFSGKDVRVIVVRPIPDLVMVDFENKKVFGVEVSNTSQKSKKKINYRCSDFPETLFVKYSRKHPNRRGKISAFSN